MRIKIRIVQDKPALCEVFHVLSRYAMSCESPSLFLQNFTSMGLADTLFTPDPATEG